jgi:DNA helicase HerA-like ATPase
MQVELQIARDLSLPLEAVTQTFGAIGRKGAGKTYLATMLAERMLDAGAQVAAIDSVGNWWGLRVGADGKSKGKEIFVLGGDHGDVPLAPEAGAKVAKLIVEKNLSAVLDISSFRIHERKRFAWEFAEELLHLKKKQRSAMHLFVEEAQILIPERVGRDEARMVGAFEQSMPRA